MCLTGVYSSKLLNKNTNTTDRKWKHLLSTSKSKNTTVIIIAISLTLALAFVTTENIFDYGNNVYAQVKQKNDSSPSTNKITIQLDSVKFAPLTDSNYNQLKVLVNYQSKDPSVVNTPMTGTMKVSLPDGTLIKTSSIQKGYVVGQSGIVQFATSFSDKTIQLVQADIYLTDTRGIEKISNVLTINASSAKSQ